MPTPVHVVGGGLAGCECAHQLATRGIDVVLWEMRPQRTTAAHQTGSLAELVCSNSLRSDDPHHAAGLLKREMEHFGSLIIAAARQAAVPAGSALAVERQVFADSVTRSLSRNPRVDLRRCELTRIPEGTCVISTGPLTSPAMTAQLEELLGRESLFFYDAISPIVEGSSLDLEKLFAASRYDRGDDDYLNAAMDEDQYLEFHRAIVDADLVALRDFEGRLFFEGCLPIEEMARRGVDTLRYGPMKPVGLRTPAGERPYAVVQLRREDLARSHFSLVGFQSRMTWGEQRRVFRMIPGLEQAKFERLGQVHRNTFINAPMHLDRHYRITSAPQVRLAGQITGVEGYLESAATGLAIGLYLSLELSLEEAVEALPPATALGALSRHLVDSNPKNYQPANINYGLFPDLEVRARKRERRALHAARAHDELQAWALRSGVDFLPAADESTGDRVKGDQPTVSDEIRAVGG
jgi:methylenetetrahydrofolate--tRNA-(uracil-5-)-methyltransferase